MRCTPIYGIIAGEINQPVDVGYPMFRRMQEVLEVFKHI